MTADLRYCSSSTEMKRTRQSRSDDDSGERSSSVVDYESARKKPMRQIALSDVPTLCTSAAQAQVLECDDLVCLILTVCNVHRWSSTYVV
jgi:hypothetical protein